MQAAEDADCQIFYGAEARTVRYDSQEWCLETSVGKFHGEWLLDCTGRKGVLAKQGLAGSFEPLQDYVSLYCFLKSTSETDQDGRTYVESNPSGWAYSALMPSGLRIVAFLSDRDLIPSGVSSPKWMQERINEGSQIKRLLKDYDYPLIEKVHQVNATSGRYQNFAGSNWILVGDSGMTFDPLAA